MAQFVRVSQTGIEVLIERSKVRVSQVGVEVILDKSKVRVSQTALEVIYDPFGASPTVAKKNQVIWI